MKRIMAVLALGVTAGGAMGMLIRSVGLDNETSDASAHHIRAQQAGQAGQYPIAPESDGPCLLAEKQPTSAPFDGLPTLPQLSPESPLASPENLASAWICAGIGLDLEYSTGVSVYLEEDWVLTDTPAEFWERYEKQNGFGSVQLVNGQWSYVQPPDKTYSGMVEYTTKETLVRVLGNGEIPAEVLVSIADSVRLSDER